MIDTLETRLSQAMQDRTMIDAMLRGVDGFERFRQALPHVQAGYTRTLLYKNDAFELVGMHWGSGAVSPIHDHAQSRCWVVVTAGTLDVDNFDRRDDHDELRADLVHASSLTVTRGDLDHRLNWRELHRVRNTRDVSAYSLQIYAPALVEYTVVNEHTGLCRTVPALYDAIFDL